MMEADSVEKEGKKESSHTSIPENQEDAWQKFVVYAKIARFFAEQHETEPDGKEVDEDKGLLSFLTI